MVQAVIDIDERTNRVLNIVKAKYGFRDKSEAIDYVVSEYEETALEPQIRPEYLENLKKIKQEKGIRFRNVSELRKSIEHA